MEWVEVAKGVEGGGRSGRPSRGGRSSTWRPTSAHPTTSRDSGATKSPSNWTSPNDRYSPKYSHLMLSYKDYYYIAIISILCLYELSQF